jgi:hypothetical protein
MDANTRVYVASLHLEHPTVLIANLPDVTWLGQNMLFRPASGSEGIVIFPRSAPPPDDWSAWLRPYRMADIPSGPDHQPAFEAYRLTGNMPLPDYTMPPQPVQNETLTLLGYQASPIFAGAQGEMLLYWQVNQSPAQPDLMPILQTEDRGTVLRRAELSSVQTNRWRAGEVLMQRMAIQIPPGTPPGQYPLRLAWVARASDHYLPFTGGGVWADVGALDVLRPAAFPNPASLPMAHRAAVAVAPGVRLLGWDDLPAARRPGENLPLTLYWQGTPVDSERPNAAIDVLLLDADAQETIIALGPMHYPTHRWQNGEIVVDHAQWPIPRDQTAGAYTLALRADDVRVEIGPLEIAGLPRQFDAPPVDRLLETGLGDALQLYGASIAVGEGLRPSPTTGTSNYSLSLELVWHALEAVETDYTVFVHLIDSTGQIITQRDVMPQENTYPTRLWAAGEYVVDSHTFVDLPPGTYSVHVGLYDQRTGDRLHVSNLPQTDFVDLGPVEIR